MCLCVFLVVLRIAQRVMAWARCCALLDGKPWFAHAGVLNSREKQTATHHTHMQNMSANTSSVRMLAHVHTHTYIYIYIYIQNCIICRYACTHATHVESDAA